MGGSMAGHAAARTWVHGASRLAADYLCSLKPERAAWCSGTLTAPLMIAPIFAPMNAQAAGHRPRARCPRPTRLAPCPALLPPPPPRLQPFQVTIDEQALLVMDFHAHLRWAADCLCGCLGSRGCRRTVSANVSVQTPP